MKPYYEDKWVTIYHGDCREILPTLDKVDLVLTDPPYPNQHKEFGSSDITFLAHTGRKMLIFWEAMARFPLEYTAIHIWHKKTPNQIVAYERIFECGGSTRCKVYAYYFMNSTVAASYGNDVFYGHPTQKPQKLISQLVHEYSDLGDLILDPFLGSGTTAYCAKKLNRKCIGIEIEEKYCEIAATRCQQSVMELGI